MPKNIEDGSVQDGGHGEILSRRRRARQDENAGADHRTNSERRKTPRPERPAQSPPRLIRARDQSIDALGADKTHRLRWPLTSFLTFFLFAPRAVPAGRGCLGAAFFRAARFSFFRSSRSSILVVFIRLF